MSEWGGNNPNAHRRNESSASAASARASPAPPSPSAKQFNASSYSITSTVYDPDSPVSPTSQSRPYSESRPSSRPMSMIQTYQPPIMEVSQDTLPELQRIFMFLNSHSNKLYQEGYFLKFHDTDTRTFRPSVVLLVQR
jgi:CCR4-NOT transcriptional complex subunit CAF120